MLTRILRRLLDRWDHPVDDAPIPPEPDGDLAWPWLNRIFLRLMRNPEIRPRPAYTWGMLQAAFLAQHLDQRRITAIEFGVAGGNGLLALERIAEHLEPYFPVGFDIVGFDSAAGLPKPVDYRDLPNLWSAGGYPMDVAALRSKLRHARLIVGDVRQTVERFVEDVPSPIGFISFDLDLYSSTAPAMSLLAGPTVNLLPRVHCYFDDVIGYSCGHHNGERLAIREFNEAHAKRQVSLIYGLRHYLPPRFSTAGWVDHKMHMAHILDHPQYAQWDGQIRHARMDLSQAA